MKKIQLFTLITLALLLTGCSKAPAGYENFYLQVDPANPETLLISSNPGNGWEEVTNCDEYCYTFKSWTDAGGIDRFRFEYSGSFEFSYFYFTAFDNIRFDSSGNEFVDLEMEIIPLVQSRFTLIIEAKLLPSETYQLSLSAPKYN